jgi:hypothetical protein
LKHLKASPHEVIFNYRKKNRSQALLTHACNPSYSGARDQEGHSSKPAWTNSFQDPILKKPSQKKKGGGVDGVVQVIKCLPSKPEALSSNYSATKKKKKEKKEKEKQERYSWKAPRHPPQSEHQETGHLSDQRPCPGSSRTMLS